MRITLLILVSLIALTSCKKDKYTIAPQIKFNSIKPNAIALAGLSTVDEAQVIVSFQLTDREGDIGFKDNADTSYVYIRNLTLNPTGLDSIKFPDIPSVNKKDLNAEIQIRLNDVPGLLTVPIAAVKPHTDTLYFEIFVKDFAKNKSNVIKTDPLYVIQQ
jgi:hypothetical protein